MSNESVSVPNLAKPQPQQNKTFESDVLMVFQKMKKLFESKMHKESPVIPFHSDFHMDIIGGKSFQNADLMHGIVNITENISAALILIFPPGTNEKIMTGLPPKGENIKGAIIEISTEAKYDYKETGMWSKWPDPRTLHYSELTYNVEQPETISLEVPCQVIVMMPPQTTKIDFENEQIYNFFKEKFLNKITRLDEKRNEYLKGIGVQEPHEWSAIDLQIAGLNLSFIVVYAYPAIPTKIVNTTNISYIIPEDAPSNYKLKMFKFLPEEFRKKFLQNIPLMLAETIRISDNKSQDAFIEQMNYIKQMRREFYDNLLAQHQTPLPKDDESNKSC
ncbi:MAG: hypothetical protein M1167_07610 [Chloroflexi bacterium]|nr:hypothetical protein [Chloroflexota bacterium]